MTVSAKFTKAKSGDWFAETMATAGPPRPRLLMFSHVMSPEKASIGARVNVQNVCFLERVGQGTTRVVEVDADDRYGLYPKVDAKFVSKVFARHAELKAELGKYEHMKKQLESLGYEEA